MTKKWKVKQSPSSDFTDNLHGFSPVILQLLYDRGLDTHEKVDEFLNPDYTQDIHDSFLFQDMQKAVDRINLAIKNNPARNATHSVAGGEKIFIHGDYDADGVTSSVVLEKTLEKLGAKNVDVFIPHREIDGYGLNMNKVDEIIEQKYDLVITVDCGITNIKEIKKLQESNIDVIVTDHHLQSDELPEAYAILNCSLEKEKYPFKKLSGVGMAFKLAQALLSEKRKVHPVKSSEAGLSKAEFNRVKSEKLLDLEAFEKWLLDLVAIGTIGDVSPILGENRTLVKYGLMVLNKTPRKGLRELIRTCSLSNGHDSSQEIPLGQDLYDLSVRNVSYRLVPRLNAVGRIAHANIAYKLLTTDNEIEAIALARDIHEKNLKRQKITEKMMEEVKEIFGEIVSENKILIAAKDNWRPGVVGLVAGKLSDEFSRPVILFAKDGDTYVGSGRSIPEFNITDSLHQVEDLLEKFGGHSQACGLTIIGDENYKKFIDKINTITNEKLKDVELIPSIEIDVELKLKDLDWGLWDELEKFEPFAESNPLPLFLIKNVIIEDINVIGKNNKHLRFYISQDSKTEKAISFGTAEQWKDKLKIEDKIDIVVEFGVNEWNGKRELQLKVVDLKHANMDANSFEEHANDFKGAGDKILHKDLCFQINAVLYEIQNRLGRSASEKQCCELAELLFPKAGLKFEREKEIPFKFDEGEIKGNRVDFFINNLVLVDFKSKKYITKDDYFQMRRYLQATKLKLGLIVNFKKYPLEIKRIINKQGVK